MGKHKSDVQIVFVSTSFSFQSFLLTNLKYFFLYLLLFIFVVSTLSCSSAVRKIEETKLNVSPKVYKIVSCEKNQIRVLLSDHQNPVAFKTNGTYKLISDNEEVGKLKKGDELTFKINGGGVNTKFNHREIDGITFLFQPIDSESVILFSGKKYKGDFLVVYSDNNKILVLNRLSMEDYLLGVLHPEMAVKSNQLERLEALKAFAVCARTFAEMKVGKGNTYFDITDDVRDQVFDGCGNYTELDQKAVNVTSGEILKFNERLAEIFYHSACGGMLEDPANVFSGKVDEYLSSKKDGDEKANCEISPTFSWKESYTQAELIKLLKEKNLLTKKQKVVKDVAISDVFDTGRAKEIRISFENGDDVILKAAEIRNFFTRKETKGILRSSLFTVSKEVVKGDLKKITLNGKGSGHGVGLCQWGAMNLSSSGKNYNEILDFYFHGCTIGKIE